MRTVRRPLSVRRSLAPRDFELRMRLGAQSASCRGFRWAGLPGLHHRNTSTLD